MSDCVKETEEYWARGLGSGLTSVEAGGGGVTLTSPAEDPGLERARSREVSSSLRLRSPPSLRSSSEVKSVISDSDVGLYGLVFDLFLKDGGLNKFL